ncbi:hypothetical protein WAI453_002710 [Rhynchosporium graminicola]
MADPLSTAGTAVGIAYGEEIAYLVRKTETIQDLLQCLEGPLRKAEAGSGDVSASGSDEAVAVSFQTIDPPGSEPDFGGDSWESEVSIGFTFAKQTKSNIIEGRLDQLDQQEIKNISNKSFPTGHGHKRISNNSKHRLCSRHRYPQATPSYIWGIYWSQAIRHQPHCPLSRYAQQRIDTLGAKYSFCTNALGFSVVATLSMARGAGFSISPHFIIRAIVPDDSPSFRLLVLNDKDLGVMAKRPRQTSGHMEAHCYIWLFYCLVVTRAVQPPTSCGVIYLLNCLMSLGTDPQARDCRNSLSECTCHTRNALNYTRTILYYASFATANRKSFDRNSPDDDLIEVLVELFNNELALEHTGIGSIGGNRSMIVHKALSRMTKEQLLGKICRAMWLRDEVELRESIELAPEYLNQAFENGETPLHLTVSWPARLAILLENKAAVSKRNNYGLTIMHAKSRMRSRSVR